MSCNKCWNRKTNGPEVLSSSTEKAKLFAKNFAANSTLDDQCCPLPDFPARTENILSNIKISARDVAKLIKDLDANKATGPDNIPVVVLKNLSPELSPILAKLFNRCLKLRCFPNFWKISSVCPVFKNTGERSSPSQYRPISLLSVISKLFESLKVVVNGQASVSHTINAGVPQGSILGPTLFLIYINDLPDHLVRSFTDIYADDTSVYGRTSRRYNNDSLAADLSADLERNVQWGNQWLVTFNPSKTKLLSFHHKRSDPKLPPVHMGETRLKKSACLDSLLGLKLTYDLKWNNYIQAVAKEAETCTPRYNRLYTGAMLLAWRYHIDISTADALLNFTPSYPHSEHSLQEHA
ncbi:hypothetical protein Bbelb_370140 [Branchiostoma belcheri]|nr:hypothetical protein Bbelb_370140 [Branchiostoma belcheri]